MALSSYEMTQVILEALSIENPVETPWGHTFKMYAYGGSMLDLFAIVEHICLKRGQIDLKKYIINGEEREVRVPKSAWGCGWYNIESVTSFSLEEVNLFFERFHYLISQQIISPGWVRNGVNLPFFHVTDYGIACIKSRDILPYDVDGYINCIQNCTRHEVWDVYYVQQVLKCFNAGVYDAATMMLGIEGEYLAKRLIEEFIKFLDKNEPTKKTTFETTLRSYNGRISKEYAEYSKAWRKIAKKKDAQGNFVYPDLNTLMQKLDSPAETSFMNYLRLTRNELAHPSNTIMEPTETMLLIVSYLKYFGIQNEFLEFYNQNS